MRLTISISVILVFGALLRLPAEDKGKVVPLEQLPAAVQKQIASQLHDGKLVEIEREEQDGETNYTVNFTRKEGKDRYFTVGEDGSLVNVEVGLEETPPAVQKTIKVQVGAGTLDNIEKSLDEDEIHYEVDFTTKENKEISLTLAPNGAITRMEVALEALPIPARKTIESHLGSGKLEELYRVFEDNEVSYEAEVRLAGRVRELVVAADGRLETLQKFLDEVPEPARKTIREKVGFGKIVRIDKSFTKVQGVEPFEVEARKDGKPFNFRVGPKGRFLGEED